MLSHGSEGYTTNTMPCLQLYISVLLHGSEGRPDEMICLKKVKIDNGIWLSIDFICRIDCSQCVFLFTSQHFKTVRNQRKETLK